MALSGSDIYGTAGALYCALVSRRAMGVLLRILDVSPVGATPSADLGVSSNFIMQYSWVTKWVRFPRQH